MSKISLKPNASGTGVFSLEAPNSNTDRTLTIPDSDGEFLFTDSNGNLSVDGDTFYVDSANNRVGVGTSNPDEALEVYQGNIKLGTDINTTSKLIFERGGSVRSEILVDNTNQLQINANNATKFFINGSEAARIDSDGNLLVSKTSASKDTVGAELKSDGRINATMSSGAPLLANRQTSDGNVAIFQQSGSTVGSISVTSSSTSYNTSSDYRLKENVTDISDGITRLKSLPVHRFNFITDPDKTVDGFLAHEVQPYVPEAVTGEKDEVEAIGDITDSDGEIIEEGVIEPAELKEGQTWAQTGEQPVYQGIDQAKLVPLLTAALQEAVGKIEQQQTQIDDLLARVTALETE